MNEEPLVSFVVPCYRCHDTIGNTLSSIQRQQGNFSSETIVVVSGWDEERPLQMLAGEKILAKTTRLFPAAARNRGAEAARGQYLAFVDADAILEPDWLQQMLASLQTRSASMVGGFIQNANPEELPSRVLHLVEFSEFLPGLPSGSRGELSTSNCLLARKLFRSLGGFDERMAMSEDWEFMRRLADRPYFCASSGILHHHRQSWGSVLPHLRELGFWSGQLRRLHPDLPGAWLRFMAPACFGLPLLRLYRIWRRAKLAGTDARYWKGTDLPYLFLGLLHWTVGFWRGIRGRSRAPRESKDTQGGTGGG